MIGRLSSFERFLNSSKQVKNDLLGGVSYEYYKKNKKDNCKIEKEGKEK